MEVAAKLVVDTLLGRDYKTVVAGGKAYTVRPMTIKRICLVIGEFSNIDLKNEDDLMVILEDITQNTKFIIRGIAYALSTTENESEIDKLCKDLETSTLEELREIITEIISLIQVKDFFDCAALAKNLTRMAATPK